MTMLMHNARPLRAGSQFIGKARRDGQMRRSALAMIKRSACAPLRSCWQGRPHGSSR